MGADEDLSVAEEVGGAGSGLAAVLVTVSEEVSAPEGEVKGSLF